MRTVIDSIYTIAQAEEITFQENGKSVDMLKLRQLNHMIQHLLTQAGQLYDYVFKHSFGKVEPTGVLGFVPLMFVYDALLAASPFGLCDVDTLLRNNEDSK